MAIDDFLAYLPDVEKLASWFIYNPKEPLLFNSGLFLGLFFAFYFGYILMRRNFRLRLLYTVAFSLFFYYKSSGLFFLLLVATTIVDYYLAWLIERDAQEGRTYQYLILSIVSNLGVLAYFQYTNFLLGSVTYLICSQFHLRYVIVPVLISFLTFQSISNIIEL